MGCVCFTDQFVTQCFLSLAVAVTAFRTKDSEEKIIQRHLDLRCTISPYCTWVFCSVLWSGLCLNSLGKSLILITMSKDSDTKNDRETQVG